MTPLEQKLKEMEEAVTGQDAIGLMNNLSACLRMLKKAVEQRDEANKFRYSIFDDEVYPSETEQLNSDLLKAADGEGGT